MAYTAVGCLILIVSALVTGAADFLVEHDWHHAIMAGYGVGLFMIFGAGWVLQRTEWGRRASPNT